MTRTWRPLELVAMVGGFLVFWPIGLAILAWKGWKEGWWMASGRHRSERCGQGRRWSRSGFGSFGPDGELRRDSGNSAFEDYKDSELKRLQAEFDRLVAEQNAFGEYIEGLRRAKDKAEFDAFLASRRGPDAGAPPAGA